MLYMKIDNHKKQQDMFYSFIFIACNNSCHIAVVSAPDYKSDSEVYASCSERRRGSSPTDPRVVQKLKKLKLDEKYVQMLK